MMRADVHLIQECQEIYEYGCPKIFAKDPWRVYNPINAKYTAKVPCVCVFYRIHVHAYGRIDACKQPGCLCESVYTCVKYVMYASVFVCVHAERGEEPLLRETIYT